jgi:hypothetical protein
MARETQTRVVLLRLAPVAHLEYLGAGAREVLLTYEEYDALSEYTTTVAAYGVAVAVELFEYSDYVGGLRCAADHHAATAVFAAPPAGLLARPRLWWLRRALRRPLYTLSDGDPLIITAAPAEPAAAARPVQVAQ